MQKSQLYQHKFLILCVLYLDNINGRVLEASIQESQACSLRHDDPKSICIKAAKSHNFKRIYVNMMNLGNNIKLDILKSVFLFKRGIFVSRDSL